MQSHRPTNSLIHSRSPYLLQHAYNPVAWQEWGAAALNQAKAENKLILISVGYSACHWCHVMERECFEDESVAEIMNRYFVCIKVDREERPDVDQVYMDAVMLMQGNGGWPLNCFALPDGRPLAGGTYFPKGRWIQLLEQLAGIWEADPGRMEGYADRLVAGIKGMEPISPSEGHPPIRREELADLLRAWKGRLDDREGGSEGAPKFPMPANVQFLLRAGRILGDPALYRQVQLTLTKMGMGGIYDHVGGGFARYSVDSYWHVPHFEKMLYDNAQLVSLYCEAYREGRNPFWKRIVEETLAWAEREMAAPHGGYYSALDADSEGEEGKYYVWKAEELSGVLGEEAGWWMELYGVNAKGNWEHGENILMLKEPLEAFCQNKGWNWGDFLGRWEYCRGILLAEREKRIRPGLDNKILASWNGLMLTALTDAALTFKREDYLKRAQKLAVFLLSHFLVENRLKRTFSHGTAEINGFLEDYALVSEGLIRLFQADMDDRWLGEAERLTQEALEHFFDSEKGLFFFTSDQDPPLVARKMELSDNVIPSSNSVMASVLNDLGHILGRPEWISLSEKMIQVLRREILSFPGGYGKWNQLVLKQVDQRWEVAIVGEDAGAALGDLGQEWHPHALVVGATGDSTIGIFQGRYSSAKTQFFLCQGQTCFPPVESVQEVKAKLRV